MCTSFAVWTARFDPVLDKAQKSPASIMLITFCRKKRAKFT